MADVEVRICLIKNFGEDKPVAASQGLTTDIPSPVLAVSGNTNYTGTTPEVVAPNLTISSASDFNGASVFIDQNFNASQDHLAVGNSSGNSGSLSGIDWNYNPTTGVLTLADSAGNNNVTPSTYQSVLEQVTYSNSNSSNPGNARTIQFSLGNLLTDPDNGHFYQFVADNGVSWTSAKAAAASQNYFGLQGYLATITSATEQQFVNGIVQGNAWIGASDDPSQTNSAAGNWQWVTGPEAGQSFWNATTGNVGVGGSAVNGSYTNWEPGEPNNFGGNELYGELLGNTNAVDSLGNQITLGKWNDLANTRSMTDAYTPQGYIVEYGGSKNDPTLNLTGSVTVNLSATTQGSPSTTPSLSTNGAPDILWRNTDNGQNAVWVLNYDKTSADTGFTLNPQSKLIQQETEQGWEIQGLYDINKDGISDIFWRNYNTGQNAIWLMKDDANGIDIAPNGAFYLPQVADVNWEIAGVADFDNSVNASILWRNYSTGQDAIWQIDYNANATGSTNPFTLDPNKTQYIATQADTNWVIKGWADFTGDKTLDILWRNEQTGQDAIWKLNNNATGANPYFNPSDGYYISSVPVQQNGWDIAGVADFNQDGIADILWRNSTTGQNAIWVMTAGGDLNPTKTTYISPTSSSPNGQTWEVAGVADFTGDGVPDILWRDYSTDETAIWRMKIDSDGTVALDKGFYLPATGDVNWQIDGPSSYDDIIS